ncbi:hypothetical protein EJ110_NYTH48918 [Nymphaea thermarum]|nr:hypothetical protein EJ110_NYTH48918 [Nymphaea thermarum]
MYSALPYAISQVAVEIPYIILQVILFTFIVYSMIGFQWTLIKFVWFISFVFLGFMYFTLLGMMLVSFLPSLEMAAALSFFFFVLWNLFSGFFLPRPEPGVRDQETSLPHRNRTESRALVPPNTLWTLQYRQKSGRQWGTLTHHPSRDKTNTGQHRKLALAYTIAQSSRFAFEFQKRRAKRSFFFISHSLPFSLSSLERTPPPSSCATDGGASTVFRDPTPARGKYLRLASSFLVFSLRPTVACIDLQQPKTREGTVREFCPRLVRLKVKLLPSFKGKNQSERAVFLPSSDARFHAAAASSVFVPSALPYICDRDGPTTERNDGRTLHFSFTQNAPLPPA